MLRLLRPSTAQGRRDRKHTYRAICVLRVAKPQPGIEISAAQIAPVALVRRIVIISEPLRFFSFRSSSPRRADPRHAIWRSCNNVAIHAALDVGETEVRTRSSLSLTRISTCIVVEPHLMVRAIRAARPLSTARVTAFDVGVPEALEVGTVVAPYCVVGVVGRGG